MMHSEYCNCGECEVRREKERTEAIEAQSRNLRGLISEIREHKKALEENTERVNAFISELQCKFSQDGLLASFYDDARKEFEHVRQRLTALESPAYGPVINDGQLEAQLRGTIYSPPPVDEVPVDSVTPRPSGGVGLATNGAKTTEAQRHGE